MKTGICGQLKGPFYAGQNLTNRIADGGTGFLRLGISLDEKDFMTYEKTGFYFYINGVAYKMGKTCMYEMDTPMVITSLSFNNETPASVIINYTTYG